MRDPDVDRLINFFVLEATKYRRRYRICLFVIAVQFFIHFAVHIWK